MTRKDASSGIRRDVLGDVLSGLIAGNYSSAEAFVAEHGDEPYSAWTLGRIMKGKYEPIRNDDKTRYALDRLDSMLDLPIRTLWHALHCDAGAIERSTSFTGKHADRDKEFIVSTVRNASNPPRDRRATDRNRTAI